MTIPFTADWKGSDHDFPDTLQDEVKRDVYYYRVYIRTDSNHLTNKQGQEFPVFPGMIATVDIKTGSKTILDYLLKPLNKAKRRFAKDKIVAFGIPNAMLIIPLTSRC